MYPNSSEYRKKITIDHTKVSGDQTYFPILVSFTSYDLTKCQTTGNDIYFTDSSNNKIPHEIETFTQSTGALIAWVKIPTLSSTVDTNIYLYYGNATCASQQDIANVWSNGYTGVWHMSDLTTSTVKDSLGLNNGVKKGVNDPIEAVGTINKGQNATTASYIEYSDKDYFSLVTTGELSLEFITNGKKPATSYTHLIGKGGAGQWEYWVRLDNLGYLYFQITNLDASDADGNVTSTGCFINDTPQHWLLTAKNHDVRIFLNGVEVDSSNNNCHVELYSNSTSQLTSHSRNRTTQWVGLIGEFRIAGAYRSAGWALTCYNNQFFPSTFITVGSKETEVYGYSITINGIDRTGDIINQSITIQDVVNDEQNTCEFKLIDLSNNGIPNTDEEIIITLNGTVVFGGYVLTIETTKKEMGTLSATITCVDYSRILDRFLVHKSYEGMTDKEIIEDIVATYCVGSGITTTNVIEGVTINQVSYNYIQVSQVLKNLCKLTGRNWYIDYNKDIHYFPLETSIAPFDISAANNEYTNLKISKDSSQIRNRVYVRGGTKLSDATDYIVVGDGQMKKFVIPDKPHNVTVSVDTGAGYVTKTIGIKNIDTTGFDWYLNFEEKYLEQDSGGSVLTTAHKLKINYQYDIPILIAIEDTASILENGVQEFAIFDKSLSTTGGARDRAIGELTDYANEVVEASFVTQTTGFISGMYMSIISTEYEISDTYIVQSVTSKAIGAGNFEYTVKLASSKTVGIIQFLIGLLEANKNLIELDDQEVVDELLEKSDAFLSDSIVDALTIDSSGPYFTWATANETSPITRMRWDLFSWMS